jgi:hypothetical protein
MNNNRELNPEEARIWQWLPNKEQWKIDALEFGMLLTFYNSESRHAIIVKTESHSAMEIERLEGFLIKRRIRLLVVTNLDVQCEPQRISARINAFCNEPKYYLSSLR